MFELKKEDLKLEKYWKLIKPYPYGDLIINIMTTLGTLPIQLILSIYFIAEILT